jgi:hypothetical protein
MFFSKDEHSSPFSLAIGHSIFPSPQEAVQIFFYTGSSHGHEVQHSERSIENSNRASRQVHFSMVEIPCKVHINGPQAIVIIKLRED